MHGGEEANETVIEPKDAVEGMTEEEAKRWREGFPETESGGRQDQVREGEAGGHSVIGGRRARR